MLSTDVDVTNMSTDFAEPKAPRFADVSRAGVLRSVHGFLVIPGGTRSRTQPPQHTTQFNSIMCAKFPIQSIGTFIKVK